MKLQSTGISVKNNLYNEWIADCKFFGGKFADKKAMEGRISTAYYTPTLTEAVDQVLELKDQLKIDNVEGMTFAMYYNSDLATHEDILHQVQQEANNREWELVLE